MKATPKEQDILIFNTSKIFYCIDNALVFNDIDNKKTNRQRTINLDHFNLIKKTIFFQSPLRELK